MNNVALVGQITTAPKIEMVNNRKKARFTLVLRRKCVSESDYVSCVAWGHNAEFVEKHLKKGDNISVVGEIRTSKYESDGRMNYSTVVLIGDVSFIRST